MKQVAASCTLGTLTASALLQRRNQHSVCQDDSELDIKILKIFKILVRENTTTLLQKPAVQCSVRRN